EPVPDDQIEDSLRDLSYATEAPFEFRHWPWHDWVERYGRADFYYNFFIYPDINFVTMGGAIYLVQQFTPLVPSETEVTLTMTTGRKRQRIPATPAILWGHLKSEKRVIDEDIVVLEGLQRGLAHQTMHALHGSYEYRLRRVAKTYRRLLGETA